MHLQNNWKQFLFYPKHGEMKSLEGTVHSIANTCKIDFIKVARLCLTLKSLFQFLIQFSIILWKEYMFSIFLTSMLNFKLAQKEEHSGHSIVRDGSQLRVSTGRKAPSSCVVQVMNLLHVMKECPISALSHFPTSSLQQGI